tara:strand:+ start:564 stop:830 length:267 start_codon:yes stop_codon:yes gene_type:complete
MSDIIRDVYRLALDFNIIYGFDPSFIYLGRLEMQKVNHVVESITLESGPCKSSDSLCNLLLIRVDAESHINVAGEAFHSPRPKGIMKT